MIQGFFLKSRAQQGIATLIKQFQAYFLKLVPAKGFPHPRITFTQHVTGLAARVRDFQKALLHQRLNDLAQHIWL